MPTDSTNKEVEIGDKVRFRGETYTIKKFNPGMGLYGTSSIEFEEPIHTTEIPDEITIDFLERG